MCKILFNWEIPSSFDQQLLRDFLRKEKEISRLALTQIKNEGELLLNGQAVTVRATLKAGDQLTVVFPPEKRGEGLLAKNIPLHIVYEDDHLLVINKQANLPTIPSKYHPENSLANAILFYYENNNIPTTFHAVNRLDRDTSGLLIVAKHRYAHDLFTKEQRKQSIKRTYIAIVHHQLKMKIGTINAPIGRKEDSIIERVVCREGQTAITHYNVMKYLPEATVVQLTLETGRTHQIRVHMASIGHPLLGDDLYGGQLNIIDRQALHSWKLQFYHPILKKELSFTVEPPADMQAVIENM